MAIVLGKFEMPKVLIKEEENKEKNYSKYTVEPFERGYGHTLGNSLRRVLLSSIEGAAITSIKIEGVQHEFDTIEGVSEDVPEIVLNLKKVNIKLHTRKSTKIKLIVEKEGEITAANIEPDSTIEILNPDQYIAKLSEGGRLEIEMDVQVGRGYRTADENKKNNQAIGVIPIDSVFTPVTKVNYWVEPTRVGERTDYDKLFLEIWTDGRILPDDALTHCAAILREHLNVFADFEKIKLRFEEKEESKESSEQEKMNKLLNTSIEEIELSVRASNCIQRADIKTIGDLVNKSEQGMLKYRNFGKKSLNEIKKILEDLGLSFGMDIEQETKEE